jgi:hypothetical protein
LATAHQSLSYQFQAALERLRQLGAGAEARETPAPPANRPAEARTSAVAKSRSPAPRHAGPVAKEKTVSGSETKEVKTGRSGQSATGAKRGSQENRPTVVKRGLKAAVKPAHRAKSQPRPETPPSVQPWPSPESDVPPSIPPVSPTQMQHWAEVEPSSSGPGDAANPGPWPESGEEAWWRRPLSGWKNLFGDKED